MLHTDERTVSAILLDKFQKRIQDTAKESMMETFREISSDLQPLTILTETLHHKCLTSF